MARYLGDDGHQASAVGLVFLQPADLRVRATTDFKVI